MMLKAPLSSLAARSHCTSTWLGISRCVGRCFSVYRETGSESNPTLHKHISRPGATRLYTSTARVPELASTVCVNLLAVCFHASVITPSLLPPGDPPTPTRPTHQPIRINTRIHTEQPTHDS